MPQHDTEVQAWALSLPQVWGQGNDYTFIETRLEDAGLLRSIAAYRPRISITVIVTAARGIRGLELCLTSLRAQDYPADRVEVIVVATQHSELATRLPRAAQAEGLRIVSVDSSQGLGAARNTGLAIARHDVLLQLDADTVLLEPDTLRWVARWFEVEARVAVGVPCEHLEPAEFTADALRRPLPVRASSSAVDGFLSQPEASDLRYRHMPYMDMRGCVLACHLADARRAGAYANDASWATDVEFVYRLYQQGAYCVLEPRARAGRLGRASRAAESNEEFLASRIPPYRRYRYRGEARIDFEVPLVSVVIPTRNDAPFIGDAIRSGLNQTLDDLEICVCDDGSDDGADAVIRHHAASDPRVRSVHTEPLGCGSASNTATRMARGEFVLALDGDDVLHPQAVERLAKRFDRKPWLGVAYGNVLRAGQDLESIQPGHSFKNIRRQQLLTCMHISAPRMYRRRLHALVGGHDEEVHSAIDYDFMLKLAERTQFEFVNQILYFYRIHHHGRLSDEVHRQTADCLHVLRTALHRMSLAEQFAPAVEIHNGTRWFSYRHLH